jgi:hypothetical protein
MDWSVYLYYMIGLFVLLSALLFALNNGRSIIVRWCEQNTAPVIQPVDHKKIGQYIFVGVLFLGVGLSLPLSERIFPRKYPSVSQEVIANKVLSAPVLGQANVDSACMKKVFNENKLTFAEGRALYPRYYEAGVGETFTDSVGYKAVKEGRMVFEMIGQRNNRIVFPIAAMPDFFPNASDVTLGFDANDRMWLVLVEQGSTQRLYFSDLFGTSVCK